MLSDFITRLEKVEHVPLSKKIQKALLYFNILVVMTLVFSVFLKKDNSFFDYILFGFYIAIATFGIIGIRRYSKSLSFKDLVFSLIVPIIFIFSIIPTSFINLLYRAFF